MGRAVTEFLPEIGSTEQFPIAPPVVFVGQFMQNEIGGTNNSKRFRWFAVYELRPQLDRAAGSGVRIVNMRPPIRSRACEQRDAW